MSLDDLVAGDAVFVDSNTLLYHFSPHPGFGAACGKLLVRIKRQTGDYGTRPSSCVSVFFALFASLR